MLHPAKVGVASRWRTVFPTHVVSECLDAPIAVVERWIGENVIGFQVFVLVTAEAVGMMRAKMGFNAAKSNSIRMVASTKSTAEYAKSRG